MNPFNLPPALYYVVTGIVLIGWAALIIFPRSPKANFWFAGVAVPVTLCLFYIYVLLTFWFLPPVGHFVNFLTLPGVYKLFGNSGLLLAGWIDLITMDLVVGAWMTRKAAQTGMPRYLLIPCLVMTFIFAGFGFALFSIAASIGGRWSAISDVEQVPSLESQPVAAMPSGRAYAAKAS